MARVGEIRSRNGQALKCVDVYNDKDEERGLMVHYVKVSKPNGLGGNMLQQHWDKLPTVGQMQTKNHEKQIKLLSAQVEELTGLVHTLAGEVKKLTERVDWLDQEEDD